jgi:cytochrome P450
VCSSDLTAEVEDFWSSRRGSSDPIIDLKSLAQLTFLDAVVKETLAHDDPFASIFRETKEDVEIGGYLIPKGWVVAVAMSKMLRDSLPGHENHFKPERWLDATAAKALEANGFQPWGNGPHTCPGARFPPAESKLLFLRIIQTFQIGAVQFPVSWKHRPALLPFQGRFLVNFVRRKHRLGD